MPTLNTTLNALVRKEKASSENWNARSSDVKKTFKSERHRFSGLQKTYHPFDDESASATRVPDERKEVGTTTVQELDFLKKFFVAAVNNAVQKERSNVKAVAEVSVLGVEFFDMPVGALLNLEHKLSGLKQVIKNIPVLDDSKDWEVTDKTRGIFKQDPDLSTFRTEKTPVNHVKAQATDKHPQQVEVIYRDLQVGEYKTRFFSGEIPVDVKARLLERVDIAIQSVVQAREQANMVDAAGPEDFSRLFDAIIEPVTKLFG